MPLTLVSPLIITCVLRVGDGAKADNAGNRFVVYRAGHIWLKLVRGEKKTGDPSVAVVLFLAFSPPSVPRIPPTLGRRPSVVS